MNELFANSGDPDQMPCSVASDLGLHCLPVTLLGVFRLQWVSYHSETHTHKHCDETKQRDQWRSEARTQISHKQDHDWLIKNINPL